VSGGALGDLPRVDRVVAHPLLAAARARLGAPGLTSLARRAIADARRAVRAGEPCPTLDAVAGRVAAMADATLRSRARRVINASGVILHTNLGRAPLARAAARALAEDAGGYTSVEIDLTTGRRGARGAFAEAALAELAGAEAALIVNNNAAAVLLALGALTARADRRAVLVSRSELIEIGGGFRVPDVLTRSGARLVEVGTTNRTRVEDYARALDETGDVAAILRVHQGNFRQTGFVERPSLSALAALARARGVLLVKDLGGGALIDLGVPGLAGEPLVRDTITAGVDLVCFSTDKVLGGPQGGALVGRADLVERARRDPLARALRLGRLPLVALEATLACYLEGALEEIPAVAAMRASLASVRARAAAWQAALAARGVGSAVVDVDAVVGGGAYAEVPIASAGLALDAPDACSAEEVSRRLRAVDLPIVARIHDGRVVVDARTVLPSEDRALLDGIVAALGPR
jgi:L-seryl-tRNA(Ser) seleniumtransferase